MKLPICKYESIWVSEIFGSARSLSSRMLIDTHYYRAFEIFRAYSHVARGNFLRSTTVATKRRSSRRFLCLYRAEWLRNGTLLMENFFRRTDVGLWGCVGKFERIVTNGLYNPAHALMAAKTME